MRYYTPSEEERTAITADYAAGESTYAIGDKIGWQPEKVGFWLKRWGIVLRPPGFQRQDKPKRQTTDRRRWIEHDGVRDTLAGWSRRIGITPGGIAARLKAGWPLERTLARYQEPPTVYETSGPMISRAEARARGLARYRDGKKCRRGHLGERYVSGSQCVVCLAESNDRKDPERRAATERAWRIANRERLKEQKRLYRQSQDKEKTAKYMREYHAANREELAIKGRAYYRAHMKERAEYLADKRRTDIQFKLADSLRKRLWMAIKHNVKRGSAVRDLGCSIAFLKEYLERQFQPGMSWDNWRGDVWQIDHILPLSSFDLSDRQQFLVACHYTNLQPLWSADNRRKSASIVT